MKFLSIFFMALTFTSSWAKTIEPHLIITCGDSKTSVAAIDDGMLYLTVEVPTVKSRIGIVSASITIRHYSNLFGQATLPRVSRRANRESRVKFAAPAGLVSSEIYNVDVNLETRTAEAKVFYRGEKTMITFNSCEKNEYWYSNR